MLKKCSVVMLPTKEKARLAAHKDGKLQLFSEDIKLTEEHQYNIYILSDEEIKEGDWCIDLRPIRGVNVFKCTGFSKSIGFDGWIKNGIVILNPKDQCMKIIATTDSSLITYKDGTNPIIGEFIPVKLPQPSQQFLEVFVREYNNGNVIKEVLVEYEQTKLYIESHNLVQYESKPKEFQHLHSTNHEDIWSLKINLKDNTITIKRVKDSWNRDEVLQLCWTAYTSSLPKMSPKHIDEVILPEFNKWMEQNL